MVVDPPAVVDDDRDLERLSPFGLETIELAYRREAIGGACLAEEGLWGRWRGGR